jgi:hypothetical protein
MDVKAFGSVYGQTASLPYGSGFGWLPAQNRVNFPACRAIFIQSDPNLNKGYLAVELSDAPGQQAVALNLQGDTLYPLSCTALISGSIGGVFVLY